MDNRTIFAQQKHGSPKRPQRRAAAADCVVGSTRDFPLNARGVRKMRERTVPTLALIVLINSIFLMVCFCLGRVDNRTIFAQQKHGSPKRRKKKLFPIVKSRASNELREPHQRSQFGEAQRTHPRPYRFNQLHLFDGLFLFGAGG